VRVDFRHFLLKFAEQNSTYFELPESNNTILRICRCRIQRAPATKKLPWFIRGIFYFTALERNEVKLSDDTENIGTTFCSLIAV
jgi:hypothetical protein